MDGAGAAGAVREAISAAGLTEADLGFKKDVVPDRNLSPMVRGLMSSPLGLFGFAELLEAEFSRPPWQRGSGGRARCAVRDWGRTPEPMREPMQALLEELMWRRGRLETMVRRVGTRERLAGTRALAVENFLLERKPESFGRWAAFLGGAGPLRDLISRAGNLDVGPAEWISAQLMAGHRTTLGEWRAEVEGALGSVERFVRAMGRVDVGAAGGFGAFDISTPLGAVRVGGSGGDRHPAGRALIIDLGGDDTYEGAGESNGLAGRPLGVAVDLGGNDRYKNGALGLWGVGLIWDERGDDRYSGGDGALGAGIFGAGALVDRGGDDRYVGDTLTQGAGLFGWGMVVDEAGSDTYQVGLQGQGFAGVNGCGLLLDRAGNDQYGAGGKYPDYGRFPDKTQSLSQGFSIGYRPFAPGGLGLLLDGGGRDRYRCEVYGQGCGYWYGCGALIDAGGDDRYEAHQYSQGSGIHLSAGLLRDRSGSDEYVNHGGLAQGGSHDFAVGLLWDGCGDDGYQSDSGSQGCAINNAVGILFEGGGDDRYRLAESGQGQGNGEFADRRGAGSVGVLVDLGGTDEYSTGLGNGRHRARNDVGVAADAASVEQLREWRRPWADSRARGWRAKPARFDPTSVGTKDWGGGRTPGPPVTIANLRFGRIETAELTEAPVERERIIALGGDPSVEELLLRAGRGGDAEWKARDRREASRELEDMAASKYAALIPWVLRRDTMSRVVVDSLVEKHGRGALGVLRRLAASEWPDVRNLCLYWLGRYGTAQDAAIAAGALRQERSGPVSLLALSRLGGGGYEDQVAPFLGSDRGLERALAVRILGRVPAPEYDRLIPMLGDPDWNVRRAAVGALSRGGAKAAARLKALRGGLGPMGAFWAEKVGTER
ncbi:MAG: HEAT repeat domain-containing protein [Verrucomicrobiae bacterium]|nr:HEAT repeat domain-containing protein [Verrucomicrobiae bacterium]